MQKKEKTKDIILKAACTLFYAKGFEETTFAAIAGQAGISQPAIYAHFENKMDLLKNVCILSAMTGRQYIDAQENPRERALERLQAYLNANLEFFHAEKEHAHALLALYYFSISSPVMREVYEFIQRQTVERIQGIFGSITPGFARVQEICNWINENITYQYGTSNSGTSAYETAAERVGVCRDFAHLAITFCRALNIPARYVSGYCLGLQPPDLHAFFHAYIDGRWVVFDATERQPRPALIQIAAGRDAADCAWSTFYGNGRTNSMKVEVTEIEEES